MERRAGIHMSRKRKSPRAAWESSVPSTPDDRGRVWACRSSDATAKETAARASCRLLDQAPVAAEPAVRKQRCEQAKHFVPAAATGRVQRRSSRPCCDRRKRMVYQKTVATHARALRRYPLAGAAEYLKIGRHVREVERGRSR